MQLRQSILLFTLLQLYACHSEYLDPPDYIGYIRNPEHGFIQQQRVANLIIEAFYQPPPYVALMQRKPGNVTNASLQKSMIKQSVFYQFMFSIRSASSVPIDEALAKISGSADSIEIKKQDMLYRLENAFTVVVGSDSIPCVFYHPQITGKLDNAYQFILSFESDTPIDLLNEQDDLHLIYHDLLWSHQNFEFVFNKVSIAKAPKLKL